MSYKNSGKSSKSNAPPQPPDEYEAAISRAIEESLRAVPLFDGYDHDFFFPRMHKEVPKGGNPPFQPSPYHGQGSADEETQLKQAEQLSLSLERDRQTQIALQHLHGLLHLDLNENPAFAPYYAKVEGLYGLTPEVAQVMLYWSVVFEPTLGKWEDFAASEAFSARLRVLPLSTTQTSRAFICEPEVAEEIALRRARRKEQQQQQQQHHQRPEVGQPSASASEPVEEEEKEKEEYFEEEQVHDHHSLDELDAPEQHDGHSPLSHQNSPPEEEETQEDVQYNPPPQQSNMSSYSEEPQIEQEVKANDKGEGGKEIATAGKKNKNINKNSSAPAAPDAPLPPTPAVSDVPLPPTLPVSDAPLPPTPAVPVPLPSKYELMGDYVMIDSDTDCDGPIAEFDPTGNYDIYNDEGDVPVAEVTLVDAASISFMDDETDAVLVEAHELLSQSKILQIQEMLRSENEEYVQRLCTEHERDVLYSSTVFRLEQMAVPITDPKSDPGMRSVDSDTPPAPVKLVCPNKGVFDLLKKDQIGFLRQFGVKLIFSRLPALEVTFASPDRDVLEIARRELEGVFADPFPLRQRLSERQATRAHIFVDNSNTFIGAQVLGINPRTRELIRNYKVRLNVSRLHNLVNNNRMSVTRYVCGSVRNPDGKDFWVGVYEKAGYKVNAIPIGIDGKEGGIDAGLIAQLYQQALTVSNASEKNVLVLLTGDGNANGGNANFFSAVKQCIERGMFVELWCWRLSLSKNYRRLADEMCNTGQFKVFYLDEYRDEIVFTP